MSIANQSQSERKSWASLPTRRSIWVLLATLVVVVVSTMGAGNLYFRGDYRVFFDDTNPQVQAFESIQATFAKSDNLSIVIAPDDGNVFDPRVLVMLRQMTEEAWQVPYSSRVDSLANYQHTEAVEDDLIVEDLLFEGNELTPEYIAKIKGIALSEPNLIHSVVNENASVTVINITLQLPGKDDTAELNEVVDAAKLWIDQYQAAYPDIKFFKAGVVAMNDAFAKSAEHDSATLIPAMLLVILVFLTFMLRSFLSVVATLVIIIGSVSMTLGLAGWAGMFISTTTVNVPTLVLTLAVADCVHVIATMRQQILSGMSKSQAIDYSIQVNATPIFITSVTTALGFLMLNMSESPALREFGNLSALGVMLACFLAISMLPAMLHLLPIKVKQKPQTDNQSDWMNRLADLVIAHQRKLLPLSILAIAGFGALIPLNKVNDEAVKYFDQSSEFRQAADFMEQNISGMTSLSIAIDSGESQGISHPDFLYQIGEFTKWLRAQNEVDHVSSLSDTYKRLNKNMHSDDESYYRLPTDRELAAQYLLLYEMSLPYGLDLNNQVNVDKSSIRLMVTLANQGSVELVDMENRINEWFDSNAPQYKITISSPELMFAHIGETNMNSMLGTLPITLILISALMVFALRSVKLGLISLVPNMAPAIIGFGVWALVSGEINLGLSVVVTLTLGIVVDDAVHFLSKYQRARKQGMGAEEAVRYAFNTVARALWITTVVLVAGFAILSMSTFRLNSDMGQLSALVVFLALVIDFVFLPALLLKFDRKEYADAEQTSQKDNQAPVGVNS